MAFVKPALAFELGLTAGFTDATTAVTWTDITDHVLSWGTSRGRQPAKPPQHFDPGQAALTLDNRDRRFDPTNTAGPYYPNLLPAKVRLRITANYPSILGPNEASMEGGLGKWETTGLNSTVTRSNLPASHGSYSMLLSSAGAGLMAAFIGNTVAGNRWAVSPGEQYTALASFRPFGTTRNVRVHLNFYGTTGALLSFSASINKAEVAGVWTVCNAVTATVPAGAVSMGLAVVVDTPAGASEGHYVDQVILNPGTDTSWSAPHPIFTGYVKRWPPEWTGPATSTVKITAVDALGAPLNLPRVGSSIWTTMVRNDRPKHWYRLGESSGTVAADSASAHEDGQYQGAPTLGQDSLVFNDQADKAALFVTGSRASIADKNLIAGYPFSFECWFRCGSDTTGARMFFSAYDGPSGSSRQLLQFLIGYSGFGTDTGKVIALVANPYPTGTQSASTVFVNDGNVHHLVIVCASSTTFKVYIDGSDVTHVEATNAHTFPNDLITGYAIGNNPAASFGDFRFGYTAGDVLDEVVLYDYALSAARILRHYQSAAYNIGETSGGRVIRLLEEANWPTAVDVDVDGGQSLLQMVTTAGGVTANLQAVEDAEQGALFVAEDGKVTFLERNAMLASPYSVSQVTLGQGATDQPYEAPVTWGNDDAELYNEASGNRVGGITFTVSDDASQATYGERPLPALSNLLNWDDGSVVDLLTWRVQRYSQPTSTVRQVRLHPAAVPALYPFVLGLGLRQRITVKVAPPGGGPVFSQESHIEHITHEVDDTGDWWTTWDISAADTATYLILDDASRGALDAGNMLAF